MTDYGRIKRYYHAFDEDNRLKWDASGRFEYEMTLRLLDTYLPPKGRILDLGGATGVYSFPLAAKGYEVYLADLSEDLIQQAQQKDAAHLLKECSVVNATDLSRYEDSFFDAVIALGPFYHLTEEAERNAAAREIARVVKPRGTVVAAFIPRLAGSIAIVDRYVRCPAQVDAESLDTVFRSGRFNNRTGVGFQEGYYAESDEMIRLFEDFETIALRSIRGFAYEREEAIESITDEAVKKSVMHWIESTACRKEIIETCGHAVYVGRANK